MRNGLCWLTTVVPRLLLVPLCLPALLSLLLFALALLLLLLALPLHYLFSNNLSQSL